MRKIIASILAITMMSALVAIPTSASGGSVTPDNTVYKGTPSKIIDGVVDPVWNNVSEIIVERHLSPSRTRPGETVTFKTLWDNNNFYFLVKVVGDKDVVVGDKKLTGSYYSDKTNILLVSPATNAINYNGRTDDVSIKVHRENPQTSPEGAGWETSKWIEQCSWGNGDLIKSTESVIPQILENLSIYETNDAEETFYIQVSIPWINKAIAVDGTTVGIDLVYEDNMYPDLAEHLGLENKSANSYYAEGWGESVDKPKLAVNHVLSSTPITELCVHQWDSGTVTKQPNYTTEGVTTFTCVNCGSTKTESIRPTGFITEDDAVFMGTPSKITNGAIDPVWSNALEYTLNGRLPALQNRNRPGLSVTFKNLWDKNNFYYLVKVVGDKDVTVDGNTMIGSFYADKTNVLLVTPATTDTTYNGRYNDVSVKVHRDNPKTAPEGGSWESSEWVMPANWNNPYLDNSTKSVIPQITENLSVYETNDAEETYYLQIAIPWKDLSVAKQGTNVGIDVYYEDSMYNDLCDYLKLERKTANCYYADGYGEAIDKPSLAVTRMLSEIPVDAGTVPTLAVTDATGKSGEDVTVAVKGNVLSNAYGAKLNINFGNLIFKGVTSDVLTLTNGGNPLYTVNGNTFTIDTGVKNQLGITDEQLIDLLNFTFTIPTEAVVNTVFNIKPDESSGFYGIDGTLLASTKIINGIVNTLCRHQNTEIRNMVTATCLNNGYSGDIYCIDDNIMLQTGHVIHALGDLTGDDTVDIRDLIRLKKFIADSSTSLFAGTGDIDNSGTIDAADIVLLRKALLVSN